MKLFPLINQEVTLIEYASFFGPVQIFKYLYQNGVEKTPLLWIYSIHGDNAELIRILEDHEIKPEDKTFESCNEESIAVIIMISLIILNPIIYRLKII